MIQNLLRTILDGGTVSAAGLQEVLESAMRGEVEPIALGGLLALLATRAVEADWLVAGARALRAHGRSIRAQVRPLIDTCGTGGDGAHTFNISTAAALVVAASGCAVAKHGNRGVSSKVGSADVLEAAGARLDLPAERARELLDATGFTFLFAPVYHPAVRHVAPVRKALGVRTLFNLLGPLANPAHAEFQLLGVYSPSLTEVVARALAELGSKSALVVHCEGLDEIGLHAATTGHLLREGRVEPIRLLPADFGVAPATLDDLRGADDAGGNERILREALVGDRGPRADAVAINAAAALWVAGRVQDLRDGMATARSVMRSGAALRVLERFVESSREEVRA
ncbi:MAG: anthranilate phosphoribosyltransferase [Planctomycetota bacterium]